ncbi:SBBP repeat-containing protein [Methanobacterium petrolearium]|nr:hypothetical protein GCM10025861_18910 [Methanobacterium petrolearium]
MVIKEQFIHENGSVITFHATGHETGTAKVDYYMGNDSSQWKTALTTWNSISLGEIYPGITVILRANGDNVEKIFLIQARANPEDIKILILGTSDLQVTSEGDLKMQTPIGDVLLSKPLAYQEDDVISVNYNLDGNIYSFQVGEYDKSKELTIDPILQYGSYLGGTRDDAGQSITLDDDGNIYITGYTDSANFPTTTGAYQTSNAGTYDTFITKLAPNSHGTYNLQYSTYLGGTNYDYGTSIAVDNEGNIYITGYTWSEDFPTTTGAFQTSNAGAADSFIVKLTPNNQGTNDLKYSTYIGGSDPYMYADDYGYSIAVDTAGNIYVTGCTFSDDFPTTTGAYQTSNGGDSDVFVVKLTPNNQGTNDLKYSTYLGGSRYDYGYGITVDNEQNIYVTGCTWSGSYGTLFPTTAGAYQTSYSGIYGDAFISKLSPDNQGTDDLKYSTFLGGSDDDGGQGIAIDNNGTIYITGYTASNDFPTTSDAYQTSNAGSYDVFISKLTPDSQGTDDLKYSTYLGGNSNDYGWSIDLDKEKTIYITGYTGSDDFPTTSGAYQTSLHGWGDAFISKMSSYSQGSSDLQYSTYLGGDSDEFGYSVTLDDAGNIYATGYTYSENFPTTSGAYQANYQGAGDAFIVKLASVADVNITKTVDNTTPYVGDTVIYTIIVRNNGPDTSYGVTVTDIIPKGLKYLSSNTSYGSYDPVTGTWTMDYLSNGETATLTITSMVLQSGKITNTARVTALTYDPVRNNTTASTTITATPQSKPEPTPVYGKTINMQNTGMPVAGLLMAVLMVLGGIISSKK